MSLVAGATLLNGIGHLVPLAHIHVGVLIVSRCDKSPPQTLFQLLRPLYWDFGFRFDHVGVSEIRASYWGPGYKGILRFLLCTCLNLGSLVFVHPPCHSQLPSGLPVENLHGLNVAHVL